MASPSDVQRVFLQAILSRAIVSEKLAQALWARSIDVVNAANPELDLHLPAGRGAWDEFVIKINQSLDCLDLEFRHLHDENSGTQMYALVNRKGDEIAQMATEYTAAEIAFFKAIIELIMLAPRRSFSVSSTVALREVSAIRPKMNMTKSQAENVLGSFVAEGWLVKSKRGRYSLSTRSLLELSPYLKSTYPEELIECTICLETLTRGVGCLTDNCQTRMHYHCFANFRRRQKQCPTCRIDWPENHTDDGFVPIGEGAAKEGDDVRRWSRNEASDDGNDDDDDDEEEQPYDEEEPDATQSQTQPRRKTQRTQRTKKTKAVQENSMDIDEEEDEDTEPEPVKRERRSQPARRTTRK